MKKISALILAAVLACSSVFSQTPKSNADSTPISKSHTVVASIIVNSDTIFQTTVDTTARSVAFSSFTSSKAPKISKHDGELVLSYDGNEYVLADLSEDAELSNSLNSLDDFDLNQKVSDNNDLEFVAVVLAIIFGFPCATIIIGLFLGLSFVHKRNRERNELINKAIECNYQLPEAFYMVQKNINGAPTSPMRDSRKFYRATTLMAVGLSLIIFAIWVDAAFFVVAGGIPLLMGIGQLIGYFCVPTLSDNPTNRPYYGPQMGNQSPIPPSQPQEPIHQSKSKQMSTNEPMGGQQTPPPYNPS